MNFYKCTNLWGVIHPMYVIFIINDVDCTLDNSASHFPAMYCLSHIKNNWKNLIHPGEEKDTKAPNRLKRCNVFKAVDQEGVCG